MTLYVTIHKAQGENRQVDPHLHKLAATQHALYFARLHIGSPTGLVEFSSRNKQSASLVRKAVEATFGPQEWKGTPDIEGMYGMTKVQVR